MKKTVITILMFALLPTVFAGQPNTEAIANTTLLKIVTVMYGNKDAASQQKQLDQAKEAERSFERDLLSLRGWYKHNSGERMLSDEARVYIYRKHTELVKELEQFEFNAASAEKVRAILDNLAAYIEKNVKDNKDLTGYNCLRVFLNHEFYVKLEKSGGLLKLEDIAGIVNTICTNAKNFGILQHLPFYTHMNAVIPDCLKERLEANEIARVANEQLDLLAGKYPQYAKQLEIIKVRHNGLIRTLSEKDMYLYDHLSARTSLENLGAAIQDIQDETLLLNVKKALAHPYYFTWMSGSGMHNLYDIAAHVSEVCVDEGMGYKDQAVDPEIMQIYRSMKNLK